MPSTSSTPTSWRSDPVTRPLGLGVVLINGKWTLTWLWNPDTDQATVTAHGDPTQTWTGESLTQTIETALQDMADDTPEE